jgi:dUTP pyrophosphatase
MTEIKIKKIDSDAKIPTYAHEGDAGMDIYSVEDLVVKAGEHAKVHTGIAMEIPDGFVALVWDKSGISMNYGLKTLGGVVDAGYRGEVVIGVVNLSKK